MRMGDTQEEDDITLGTAGKGYMDNSTKEGEGRRLVTYKVLKRRGRTAWEARVCGRCRKAARASGALPARELADKGAGAGCGLGVGCGAEGVGVHYV